MAWIVGLVTEAELEKLREIGWRDEDPPSEMLTDSADGLCARAFHVDSDVYKIMTGSDWEQPDNG